MFRVAPVVRSIKQHWKICPRCQTQVEKTLHKLQGTRTPNNLILKHKEKSDSMIPFEFIRGWCYSPLCCFFSAVLERVGWRAARPGPVSQPRPSRAAAAVKQIPSVGVQVCSEISDAEFIHVVSDTLPSVWTRRCRSDRQTEEAGPESTYWTTWVFTLVSIVKISGFPVTCQGQLWKNGQTCVMFWLCEANVHLVCCRVLWCKCKVLLSALLRRGVS